jgi:hypothetical protein
MKHFRRTFKSLFATPFRTIVIEASGGLGNQLFQLAAGLYLRKITGRRLFLDTSWFTRNKVHDGFVLNSLLDLEKMEIQETNRVSRYLFTKKIKEPWGNTDIALELFQFPTLRTAYLQGYFLDYHIAESVRDELVMSLRHLPVSLDTARMSIFIHLRYGDKLNPEIRPLYDVVDIAYYADAIRWCQANYVGQPLDFYVFSDSEIESRQFVKSLAPANYIFQSSNSAIQDFSFMYQCQGAIASNSSFSYWAGMLQTNQRFWIMPWRWDNITPDDKCRVFGPRIVRLPLNNISKF